MKRRMFLVSVLAVFWATSVFCASNAVVIASWNVENFFDTEDDPDNEGDDGFTPRGWMRWTEARYRMKLDHLSDIIAQMRPDVLCLTEIENRRVLEDLVKTLKARHDCHLPEILHRDGNEKRGIDVAILARYVATGTNWFQGASGQRECLAGDFVVDGRAFTVIVNHWKSQLGKKNESDAVRRKEALAVRAFIDQRLAENPAAAILVAGDFNDAPTSPILTEVAGFVMDRPRVLADKEGRLLLNLAGGVPEDKRATYYYAPQKQWNVLDTISVTRGMLPEGEPASPWRVREESYTVFKTPAQCNEIGAPLPFRRVRNKDVGDIFMTGYSDHFPVKVVLEPR